VANDDKKRKDGIGCLPFLLGAVAGFALRFCWSNAQVHKLGSHTLLGDNRGVIVIGHAMAGALVGGLLVSLIAFLRRPVTDKRKRKNEQD